VIFARWRAGAGGPGEAAEGFPGGIRPYLYLDTLPAEPRVADPYPPSAGVRPGDQETGVGRGCALRSAKLRRRGSAQFDYCRRALPGDMCYLLPRSTLSLHRTTYYASIELDLFLLSVAPLSFVPLRILSLVLDHRLHTYFSYLNLSRSPATVFSLSPGRPRRPVVPRDPAPPDRVSGRGRSAPPDAFLPLLRCHPRAARPIGKSPVLGRAPCPVSPFRVLRHAALGDHGNSAGCDDSRCRFRRPAGLARKDGRPGLEWTRWATSPRPLSSSVPLPSP